MVKFGDQEIIPIILPGQIHEDWNSVAQDRVNWLSLIELSSKKKEEFFKVVLFVHAITQVLDLLNHLEELAHE